MTSLILAVGLNDDGGASGALQEATTNKEPLRRRSHENGRITVAFLRESMSVLSTLLARSSLDERTANPRPRNMKGF
jgi:hypothetical protein